MKGWLKKMYGRINETPEQKKARLREYRFQKARKNVEKAITELIEATEFPGKYGVFTVLVMDKKPVIVWGSQEPGIILSDFPKPQQAQKPQIPVHFVPKDPEPTDAKPNKD